MSLSWVRLNYELICKLSVYLVAVLSKLLQDRTLQKYKSQTFAVENIFYAEEFYASNALLLLCENALANKMFLTCIQFMLTKI